MFSLWNAGRSAKTGLLSSLSLPPPFLPLHPLLLIPFQMPHLAPLPPPSLALNTDTTLMLKTNTLSRSYSPCSWKEDYPSPLPHMYSLPVPPLDKIYATNSKSSVSRPTGARQGRSPSSTTPFLPHPLSLSLNTPSPSLRLMLHYLVRY
jgi:hypothetical protein